MTELAALKGFDLAAADLTVWVFKKSKRDNLPVFTGRWVGITDELASALRESAAASLEAITETIDYEI